jgi:hypothetical protein
MNEAYHIFLHIYNTKILNSDMNSYYGIQKLKFNRVHKPQQNRITFTFHAHKTPKTNKKLFTRDMKKISIHSWKKQELNTLLHKWQRLH